MTRDFMILVEFLGQMIGIRGVFTAKRMARDVTGIVHVPAIHQPPRNSNFRLTTLKLDVHIFAAPTTVIFVKTPSAKILCWAVVPIDLPFTS